MPAAWWMLTPASRFGCCWIWPKMKRKGVGVVKAQRGKSSRSSVLLFSGAKNEYCPCSVFIWEFRVSRMWNVGSHGSFIFTGHTIRSWSSHTYWPCRKPRTERQPPPEIKRLGLSKMPLLLFCICYLFFHSFIFLTSHFLAEKSSMKDDLYEKYLIINGVFHITPNTFSSSVLERKWTKEWKITNHFFIKRSSDSFTLLVWHTIQWKIWQGVQLSLSSSR